MVMKSSGRTVYDLAAKGVLCLSVGMVTLGLSACSGTPYVDSRREAGQISTVGASTPDRVAICYSSQSTTLADVMKLAESECAKTDRIPRFSHQDDAACALMAPTRAFFRCVAKP
jgi:hypothetical protein